MMIEHIAVWTKDLERLRSFYIEYFGAKSNEKYFNPKKNFSSYFLSFESGARLEIMEMPSVPESKDDPHSQFTGLIHLAFSVGTEAKVDELTARLVADGYEKLDGPRTTGDGYYESCVLDPDGNRLEITV
jgi:lactoylglutathione lyase